jgi:GT2 family glycosyltransferase
MSGATTFSVVLATKGRPEVLRETIESVLGTDPAPHEVVVVDGDDARTAEPVALAFEDGPVPVRYASSPPGLTVQRNRGLELATGDVAVFVDDDTFVDPGLFAALADAYAHPAVVGATGRVVDRGLRRFGNMRSRWRPLIFGRREGSFTRFGYPRWIQDESRERDVEHMLGGLMTARREAALRVGFDERLSGYGLCEDEDFSYRLSRAGRIRYLPRATVVHRNVDAAGKLARSREFNRMVVVNRAYLFRKNFERTARARVGFAMLVAVLVLHRAVNADPAGVRGLIEGSLEARRQRA